MDSNKNLKDTTCVLIKKYTETTKEKVLKDLIKDNTFNNIIKETNISDIRGTRKINRSVKEVLITLTVSEVVEF